MNGETKAGFVSQQYQSRTGEWRDFVDERHRRNTIKDGTWPIRDLYPHPPESMVADLLEALRAIAKNDPHRLMTSGDIAREAIAKATGEAL